MPTKKNSIDPVQQCLLLEKRSKYANLGHTTEERFGTTTTQGLVLAIAPDIADECKRLNIKVGDIVYYAKYEDNATAGASDEQVLIKLEEIRGRSDATD